MAAQKGGIRVLLVDDHRMVRESIRRLLTSAQNIDVVGKADNGAEAIASIGKLSPQVVVMDINMPKMERTSGDQAGAETLSKRRRDYPSRKIAITNRRWKARPFRVMTKGTHGVDDLRLEIEKAAATMQSLSRAKS
jgi:DNA-binding NarL/FixJ family response regulator